MSLSLHYELLRKAIHIFTTIIPVFYLTYWTKEQTVAICLILFILFLIAETGRKYVIVLRQIFEKLFSKLLRQEEFNERLTGATLLFGGLTLSAVFFDKNIAIAAMLNLTVSDALAALAGKTVGKTRIGNKTLEGTIIFFLAAVICGVLLIDNIIAAIVAAFVVTLVELYVTIISDNLTIPLTTGLIFTVILNYI